MARLTRTFLSVALFLATTSLLPALEPLSYQEISLLLRTGETPQAIASEAARRKVLQPLTAEQVASLRALGASEALLANLNSPTLAASTEEVAAYNARRRPGGGAPIQPAPATGPAPATVPLILSDTFKAGLEASKKSPPRAMKLTDAYSMAQLPQAMAKAQAERKPLGFIMVWDVYFTPDPYSPRFSGGQAALVHFYEAFKDSLVLVFVRHENELGKVPKAVKVGFEGPDEGGFAPNMCVVDATATEFVVEIPMGGAKSTGPTRDEIFKAKAAVIHQWLGLHPMGKANLPAPPPK